MRKALAKKGGKAKGVAKGVGGKEGGFDKGGKFGGKGGKGAKSKDKGKPRKGPPPPGPPPSNNNVQPPPAAVKRPAEEISTPQRTVSARKENWNPWAEATVEQTVEVDPEKAEMQEFLKNAPRPGEDWEMEEDDEEEEPQSSKAAAQGEEAGLLGGVLSDANTTGDAPPAKASSIASLLASLPKPTGSD